MNAIATIAAGDSVEALRGWESGHRKALRRRLIRIRDRAAARAASCQSEAARDLYWRANSVAGNWAFSHEPDSRLEDVANALVWLGLSATKLEEIEILNG